MRNFCWIRNNRSGVAFISTDIFSSSTDTIILPLIISSCICYEEFSVGQQHKRLFCGVVLPSFVVTQCGGHFCTIVLGFADDSGAREKRHGRVPRRVCKVEEHRGVDRSWSQCREWRADVSWCRRILEKVASAGWLFSWSCIVHWQPTHDPGESCTGNQLSLIS